MAEVKLDLYLSFPIDAYHEPKYAKLVKYCGSVEDVEQNFEIEFSCGDGKYFSDFWKWTEGGALVANWPDTPEGDEEVYKYDGKVCTDTPPRLLACKMSMVHEQMVAGKGYRFTIKYYKKTGEEVYYINNKERSSKAVEQV
jgi:hypothetical protein